MMRHQAGETKELKNCNTITTLTGIIIFISVAGLATVLAVGRHDTQTSYIIHISLLLMLFVSCTIHHMAMLALKKQISKLMEHSSTDKLTELYNRSYLDLFLEKQIETSSRSKTPVSIIMVDLDHFKEINDNYGHVVGDHVLTIFAHVVLKCVRKTDIIARYGGDEFIVVLPDTDTETAEHIAERIRRDVESEPIPPVNNKVVNSISCSVGVSTYPSHCDSKHNLIQTSDMALYEAKRAGRNRTVVYSLDSITRAKMA